MCAELPYQLFAQACSQVGIDPWGEEVAWLAQVAQALGCEPGHLAEASAAATELVAAAVNVGERVEGALLPGDGHAPLRGEPLRQKRGH